MSRKSAPPQLGSTTGNWRSKKPSSATSKMPTIPEDCDVDEAESPPPNDQTETAQATGAEATSTALICRPPPNDKTETAQAAGAEATSTALTYRERMQELETMRQNLSETVASSLGTVMIRGRTREQGATPPERRRHTLSRSVERQEAPDASLLGLINRLKVRMSLAQAEQLEAARELNKLAEKCQLTIKEKHELELAKENLQVQGRVWMVVTGMLLAYMVAYVIYCAYYGPEFAYLRQRRIEVLGLEYGRGQD